MTNREQVDSQVQIIKLTINMCKDDWLGSGYKWLMSVYGCLVSALGWLNRP